MDVSVTTFRDVQSNRVNELQERRKHYRQLLEMQESQFEDKNTLMVKN